MASLRVAAIQMRHGDSLDENLRMTREHLDRAESRGVGLALLPEYFFSTREGIEKTAEQEGSIRAFLSDESRRLDIAVVGNVVVDDPDGTFNVGVAYDRGRLVAEQRKVHPMPREAAAGIAGGLRLDVFSWRDIEAGLLVCADILYPEAARILALKGARLLLNPVMSSYRAEDPTKGAREALYIARAYDAGAFVVKAGGWRENAIAGRSLIASPWGMLARYQGDFTDEVLVADLDFDQLDAFRKDQGRFPGRRPEAYGDLM